MKEGVSVIVCCYNSSWIIERCLKALLAQKINGDLEWEIIVIINACTDNTREIALNILKGGNVTFQIADEHRPGLLNARKKGISCANFNYSLYCDDDNLLCDVYVQTAYDIMSSRPLLGALGGKGVAEFQSEPHSLVLNNIRGYAVGSQKDFAADHVWGAGVCLRTEVVRKIYRQQKMHLTGRKGDVLLAGDDGELVLSIRLNGYESDCDDRLLYTHVLTNRRLTVEYLIKMFDGFALASPIVVVYHLILTNKAYCFIMVYYIRSILSYFYGLIKKKSDDSGVILRYKRSVIKAYKFWTFEYLHNVYRELESLYR